MGTISTTRLCAHLLRVLGALTVVTICVGGGVYTLTQVTVEDRVLVGLVVGLTASVMGLLLWSAASALECLADIAAAAERRDS